MIRHALIATIVATPVMLMAQTAQPATTFQASAVTFSNSSAPTPAPSPGAIGSKLIGITVEDTAGSTTFKPSDAPATVLVFVSATCPVSNAYNARMNALYNDYGSKHVRFIFADANVTETLADIRALAHRSDNPLTVPTYRDADNVLADQLGAHATPEAYVIDSTGVLRYHGSIDNSKDPSNVTAQSLRSAIDAVLVGKVVQVATTRAFGCTIKRKNAA